MAFIPVPGVIETRLSYIADGNTLVNVLHFTGSTNPDNTELVGLSNDVVAWWNASVSQYLSNELQLVEVQSRGIGIADGLVAVADAGLPGTGGLSSEILALNSSIVVTGRTGHAGRSFRSRTYLPGLAEVSMHGNEYTGAVRSGVQAAFNELVLSSTFAGHRPCVVSRYHDKAPRTTGIHTLITSFEVRNQKVGSQRRRVHRG
jgi:hypothetical protein